MYPKLYVNMLQPHVIFDTKYQIHCNLICVVNLTNKMPLIYYYNIQCFICCDSQSDSMFFLYDGCAICST